MRDSKPLGNSLLAAATILALDAGGVWVDDIGHIPTPQNPGHKHRSKSTHKQNARKARKLKGKP